MGLNYVTTTCFSHNLFRARIHISRAHFRDDGELIDMLLAITLFLHKIIWHIR